VLVATASLELGIDVGTVDLAVQINSPRSIAVALQRVGRSGHWRGAVPKGRFFATTRDDLMECAALVRAIRLGDLDRLIIPESPLDVLAQQIVAICASGQNSMDSFVGQGRGQDGLRDSQRGRRRYYERGRHLDAGATAGPVLPVTGGVRMSFSLWCGGPILSRSETRDV